MRKYLYNLATDKYRGFGAGVIKLILFLCSLLYGRIVRVLMLFYRIRPCRLSCRVISVGNITLGGTGKTTLAEHIASYLKEQGHKIAILSRGYKRNPGTMGDEPYMLSRKLPGIPVLVDSNRIRSAKLAIRDYGVDTVILDDGLQQWRIIKDLEIVTIDARNPFGNRRLLPRGILRQPLSSLKLADLFVLSKANLVADTVKVKEELSRFNPQALLAESSHTPAGFYSIAEPGELLNTAALKGSTVSLFSGIGDPESFEDLISCLGIKIGLSFRFPDHHHYTRQDLDKIAAGAKDKGIDTIVTTQKDAARLAGSGITDYACLPVRQGLRVLVLRIELKIKDEERFRGRLLKLYLL
jgi:tetraacyldisaccharide 4'-kinase